MKKCPFCAEEIQDEAIVCRYCGRDLVAKPDAPITLKEEPPVVVVATTAKKNPAIGGAGCVLAVIGILLILVSGGQGSQAPGLIMIVVGVVILGYALATGNIKLFG